MAQKKTMANFNIGGDTVKTNLREMVERAKITEDQSNLISWFFNFAKNSDWTLAQAAEELGVDNSTLWRVLNNNYGAKLDNFCGRIERYKVIALERSTFRDVPFVETQVSKKIFQVCNAALFSQTIAFAFGDSQIGKTTALEEYARQHNHGQTKYIRLPASAGVQMVAREVARACHVSPHSSFEGLRDRILKAVDNKDLIIVDELHQCFMSYHKHSQIKVLEFLREIHDRTKCGMVLCGTHVLKEELERGKLALLLEQLRRRGTIKVDLPSKPPKRDLDHIAAEFGLPTTDAKSPEYELIKVMIRRSGLGMYVKFLQAASSMANKEKQKLSWDHFIAAHDIIAKLSQG